MIIYKLTINSVTDDPVFAIGTFSAPREERQVEYYMHGEKAYQRANEIHEGMIKLVGFIPKVEAIVTEIKVIE